MRPLDWIVLIGALLYFVVYGVWKGRRNRDLNDYLLADRQKRWYTVALSIMATQASAITFLSTPGQAYTDGMRFVQFYFGLPLAMVVLSVTAVPIYHRLKVFTAYEFLEQRFDLKTRAIAAALFLVQRGLACGLTIYAPSVIFSILLGWNLQLTILLIGGMVVIYTASGGMKAVDYTNFQQMVIILLGMLAAFIAVITLLPSDISLLDAVHVAGKGGRLNLVDTKFDPNNRYNIWTGLLGGFFLALSYFGTDQSQVGRYLGGKSVAQSRLGLLFNGIFKVPMQFFILGVGAMVFVFYQFVAPPLFFNSVEERALAQSRPAEHQQLVARHKAAIDARESATRTLVGAIRSEDDAAIDAAQQRRSAADAAVQKVRSDTINAMKAANPKAETNDTNYVFLTFVLSYLPAGLVGLVLAAAFAASMSSTSSELNALTSTTVVDFYKRMFRVEASEHHYVLFSKLATLFWGAVAILFAEFANQLGSLVEAVNQIGSLFYGTILGIFLLAFYVKRVGGTAAFTGAIVGEATVLIISRTTEIAYLWFNVIGCVVVVVVAYAISLATPKRAEA